MAYKMGVTTHLSSYPAEALGGLTLGVTPLEMADVYATLADGGWRNTPIAITKVVFPDGHVDANWGTPHRVKVLSEGVTAEETSILEQNVQSGTATRSAIGCPTAAKTGTTSELVDAWLDGYTPGLLDRRVDGLPNRRVSMTDVHGEPQQGGYLPAEIWHAYMSAVTEGKPCVPFPPAKESISYQAVLREIRHARADLEAATEAETFEPQRKDQQARVGHAPPRPRARRRPNGEALRPARRRQAVLRNTTGRRATRKPGQPAAPAEAAPRAHRAAAEPG